jgi:hypothetical protein
MLGVSQLQAQSAPWVFGLGTGFSLLNTEGTMGFNTSAFGPIEAEYDLSPDDVQDLVETAFGFGVMASDGTWTVKASFVKIKLVDEPSGTLDADFGSLDWAAEVSFEITGAEVTVGRTVYRSAGGGFSFTPHVGVRYTKHDLGNDLTIDPGGVPMTLAAAVEEKWTDFLVGTSFDFHLSPKVTWGTKVNAGFGGSEGTYHAATALTWKPAAHWAISPNASYTNTDFENGTRGDSDWYLYDSDDIGFGLAVMYLFF